jgi:3-deoxy-D-manno-octulosonate 8-phosphate phosphatase (KDO 8-P phosphatase)
MSNFKTKLHNIKAFAFDVDGVMTDGLVIATETGDLLRMHNAKDGFALRTAILTGYKIAIITGGTSESLIKRFQPIGIEDIHLGAKYKIPYFNTFLEKYNLKASEVLYMGDDIPDLEILNICGVSACPADAVTEVKKVCDYISIYPGGKGCVRDVIEQVLKIQEKWNLTSEAIA